MALPLRVCQLVRGRLNECSMILLLVAILSTREKRLSFEFPFGLPSAEKIILHNLCKMLFNFICILPCSAVQRSTRYVLVFDVFVIAICLASLILCTRSIVLALRLRKVRRAPPFLPPLSLQPALV